ncbi:ABC-type sugar transport system substrate-binding protein [Clostridium beijerinckii]|nr:ABC-type sugar transport system substrate-binding protein [Clostridium beijerinckii]
MDKNKDNILQYIMLTEKNNNTLTTARTRYSISTINISGIKTEELSRISSEGTKEAAQMIMESTFLKYGDKIEAIIANNDTLAIGAINALQKYGYNIGNKSIPVVGADAIPEARELIKKGSMLGTVIQDPSEMAEALYKVGMNLIYNRPPLSNTNYKFNETGFVVEMPYREYKE